MMDKESEETVTPEPTMTQIYQPGQTVTMGDDMCMYPGHAFTTDPHGGIFKKDKTYVVEDIETLKKEKRGDYTEPPEEEVKFTLESVVEEDVRTQFIVKP